jgi:hypothetical protein
MLIITMKCMNQPRHWIPHNKPHKQISKEKVAKTQSLNYEKGISGISGELTCEYCKKTINRGNYFRYHGEKCNHKWSYQSKKVEKKFIKIFTGKRIKKQGKRQMSELTQQLAIHLDKSQEVLRAAARLLINHRTDRGLAALYERVVANIQETNNFMQYAAVLKQQEEAEKAAENLKQEEVSKEEKVTAKKKQSTPSGD